MNCAELEFPVARVNTVIFNHGLCPWLVSFALQGLMSDQEFSCARAKTVVIALRARAGTVRYILHFLFGRIVFHT